MQTVADLPGLYNLALQAGLNPKGPGPRYKARCPNGAGHAHGDRKPSLSLDDERGIWKCHGCGLSGGIKAFCQLVGVPFESTGSGPYTGRSTASGPQAQGESTRTDKPPQEGAQALWERSIADPQGLEDDRAVAFLDRRGLRATLGDALRILPGDAPKAIQRFPLAVPCRNAEGEIVRLHLRNLDETRECRFYPSGEAEPSFMSLGPVPDGAPLMICEGLTDWAVAASSLPELACIGLPGAESAERVATALGARLKGRRVVLGTDADEPGDKAAETFKRVALAHGASCTRLGLEGSKDLCEFVAAGRDLGEAVRAALAVEGERPVCSLGDAWPAYLAELERRASGAFEPASTAIDGLDRLLGGGFPAGQTTLLSGAPGRGKTSFAVDLGLYQARHGRPVVFLSLEMSIADIFSRLVSLERGLPWGEVRRGMHLEACASVGQELAALPYRVIDPGPGQAMKVLEAEVGRLGDLHGAPPFVAVDYGQRLSDGVEGELRQAVEAASGKLLALAKRTLSPVLILSAVGRGAYGMLGSDNRPELDAVLKSARESGRLEFDAAAVLGIVPVGDWSTGNQCAWLAVAKNRFGGGVGAVPCRYNGLRGRFTEASEDDLLARGSTDDEFAERVLKAIREHAPKSIAELQQHVRGKRERVRGALGALVDGGRVSKGPGKEGRYVAND